jgi:hypothetical protein
MQANLVCFFYYPLRQSSRQRPWCSGLAAYRPPILPRPAFGKALGARDPTPPTAVSAHQAPSKAVRSPTSGGKGSHSHRTPRATFLLFQNARGLKTPEQKDLFFHQLSSLLSQLHCSWTRRNLGPSKYYRTRTFAWAAPRERPSPTSGCRGSRGVATAHSTHTPRHCLQPTAPLDPPSISCQGAV